MASLRAITRSAKSIARRLRREGGFTLIELMVAMLVIAIGVISVVAGLDNSRQLTGAGEKHEFVAHIAQAEVEKILSMGYASIGDVSAPAPSNSGNKDDPLNYVKPGPAYAYDWTTPATTEPFVTGGTLASSDAPVTVGRFTYTTWRFITSVSDPCPSCSNANDYKRVTVVVTVTGGPRRTAPFIDSTIVRPPT